jgi:transcriptional regulator with XRE-family HTH domain
MSPAQDPELGAMVRNRRRQLGLSARALAARAAISPAYVTAIETARNPSTGRPPTVSLGIAQRLADALEIDLPTLIGKPSPHGRHAAHVLAYVVTPPPGGTLAALDAIYGADVDHWLHIIDPRTAGDHSSERVTERRFALGSSPYATPEQLDPDSLVQALDREVATIAPTLHGRRVGLLIADCSAVMRYLHDASAEVAVEAIWHDAVTHIWQTRLGASPAIDVCAYQHDDIAALGLTIDRLQSALDLITRHDNVLLIQDNGIVRGAPAIRRILATARPPGATTTAWDQLTAAAAHTLAGAPQHPTPA